MIKKSWFTYFSTLIFLVIGVSCSHIKSGHYVQLKKGQKLEDLAKELKVDADLLKTANHGRSIASDGWVFIPLKRGVLGQSRSVSPSQYFDNGILMWPVPSESRVSSRFGRRWGRQHEGIDIPGRRGAHIVASQSGTVVYSGKGITGYGNITVISHPNHLFTVYAHARKNYTKKGQYVHQGQVIAELGNTGRSTAPHLHFEVRKNSKALDPLKYLSQN